ncbi:MAG TPA: nicotinate phosphoribosyltransferase [Bryobacteraceae bacterium]|nr:nicotinate phosphoribosyltransferase [Bryobacteraceae bacterium]
MLGLHTDLYQLTMAAGFFQSGKAADIGTFELFVRRFPRNRDILIAAGLPQAIDYLLNLSFTSEEIEYLRALPPFRHAVPEFFDYLARFRFTGDLFAMAEGTPFFPGEPIIRVRAPLIEAQIPETYLLSIVSFQTLIATKAVRVVEAAAGRPVIEFGTRRAHSPEAGVLAARASYIGGCIGTSNVEAGLRYGIPTYGTSAHSWVMAFEREEQAFRELHRLLGEGTTYLVDTYDTIAATRAAAALGRPMWGVRLDSGDMAALSREVRQVLDAAGLRDAKIMVSGDLNENRIRDMLAHAACVDAFGVGTELATSSDAPNLSAVYKMVEIESAGVTRSTAKFSAEKATLPGAKQVFRYPDHDRMGTSGEAADGGVPLLEPVILNGRAVKTLPAAAAARDYCATELRRVRPGRRIEYSERLNGLANRLRTQP